MHELGVPCTCGPPHTRPGTTASIWSRRTISALILRFDGQHFFEPARKSLFRCNELGADKRIHNFVRQRGPDNSRAKRDHVHIVMLHALVCRVSVVAHPGTDTRNLVRRHTHTHTRAADENPTRRYARLERVAHLLRKVRVIVWRIAVESSQVDDLMALLGQIGAYILFERKARMIRTDETIHRSFLLPSECI